MAEELVGRAHRHARHAVEVGHPVGPLHHLPRRPAAAIAVAERHQRPVAPPVFLEVGLRIPHFGGGDLGVVGIDRREVCEHPRPIEALPPEGRVREDVLLVPTQLLRDEASAAALLEDLRQRSGIAEHVGNPDHRAATPEPGFEVALSEDQLAHDALAAGQVHVGLDPHPADRMPLTLRNLVADALEDRRMTLLDPVVLRGLRALKW